MTDKSDVCCVADMKAVLGEGPIWVEAEQALYWVDIKGRSIFRLDSAGNRQHWETPLRVGSIAPRADGGFIAGTEYGFAEIDLAEGRFDVFNNPEEDRPDNRFNDGKVDAQGRFWAGTMDDTEQDSVGTLYRLDPDRSCRPIDQGYKVTNGPAFSPDGRTLYHTDSARQVIYAFPLGKDGDVGERREFARFDEGDGYPDGMTVDSQGCLWVAFWDGWCLRRLSPGGQCLQKIDLPVQRPTSCAFGGPGLDRLYITSASIGLDEAALALQPCAGGLLLLEPGVTGIAAVPFAG
ncbi:MAG: SMP-30/gluconolactonase/LRE family protein [Pseudomonadota bacterium]|nr:SMP-30/gluconolactonase/LRE family protein [Sphingomonas sp.]MDQ3479302.1 SMP-30/gluconolactonase/LRE family protein [Pseudomonadota bacterium]